MCAADLRCLGAYRLPGLPESAGGASECLMADCGLEHGEEDVHGQMISGHGREGVVYRTGFQQQRATCAKWRAFLKT